MGKYLELSKKQQQLAEAVISDSGVMKAWQKIGAKINLVGSLKMGLLAKHRDIDFHIYTPELDIAQSFAVITELAGNPHLKKVEFANQAQTEECCLEWHVWFEDKNNDLWLIDMIQIKQNSKYDGYFEKTAAAITACLNEESRETILKLKYETPDEVKISGMEYYKAVIQDGIKDYKSFMKWRKEHRWHGIIDW